MTDPATDEANCAQCQPCPRCNTATAAAKVEIGLVAKACIEQLGRVADDVIGLIREARATEQSALHAWKAAADLSGNTTTTGAPRTRTDWRLQFVTDSRNPVTGNARPSRTEDGRWLHTLTSPLGESIYRMLAARAEQKGVDDIRLSKRTVVTAPGSWLPIGASEWEDA